MGLHKGDQKPEGRRPKGFWSPEGKPTKPESKCFAPILTWYPSQTNVIKKTLSSNAIFLGGLLVTEGAFGETTEPSSLVINLIYSVWLFYTNDKENLLIGIL